mmetsp:Transcript_1694/g.2964  ORF Transcript_1694/g.2964 Transcript_1694/m.2964 type:complete len:214 (+) Transcript_1694:39-680(+)
MRLLSIPCQRLFGPWLAFIVMAQVSAMRDDHIGTELDSESGRQKQTLNLSITSDSNRSVSLKKRGEDADSIDPLTLTVAVAEQSILTVVETQIRLKAGGGTCPEELKIPPTPGVQLKPEWLYGVGCRLDKGKLCHCPLGMFYGCQVTGMFGLPGGLTTDVIKKMGFCRIEPWVFIFPSVALLGAIIYFTPASRRRETSQSRNAKSSGRGDDSD